MTKSFVSFVFTYSQNAAPFKSGYRKARTDTPMLFSSFKYNFGFWTKDVISWGGNLVLYNCKSFIFTHSASSCNNTWNVSLVNAP